MSLPPSRWNLARSTTALLFDFVEALDKYSWEILEIGVDSLLLLEVAKLIKVAFEDEAEERIILAADFQFDFGGVNFGSLRHQQKIRN